MTKHLPGLISGALIAAIALFAISFFWKNPFRVGEITVSKPNGPSMTFKVANSDDISELIRRGLEKKESSEMIALSLLNIIEHLPPGCPLGDKLVDLVERRRPPFAVNSVPVRLLHDPKVPQGLAAVCETSEFLAKNVVVFILGAGGELLQNFQVYVDGRLAFPCAGKEETLRVNSASIEGYSNKKVMAKRTF